MEEKNIKNSQQQYKKYLSFIVFKSCLYHSYIWVINYVSK